MPFDSRLKHNLLGNSPDGLGKHISVEIGRTFTRDEVIVIYLSGDLPFYFTYNNITYAVIVDSDIIPESHKLCATRPTDNDNLVTPYIPDLNTVSSIINRISWYLDKMYAYLRVRKQMKKVTRKWFLKITL